MSAKWCAKKCKLHNIPVKKVTKTEWDAGSRGFISGAEDGGKIGLISQNFDWVLFLKMIQNELSDSTIDV